MTNAVHVVCPWIPADGSHAGYEVLQSYKRSAANLNVKIRVDIIGEKRLFSILMKISRWMINRNLYSLSLTLNLTLTVWLFLKYRNKNTLLYIEPHFLILAQYLCAIARVGIIVHDDPIAYLKRNKKSEYIISRNSKRFQKICVNAICGIFISEFMKNTYKIRNEMYFQAVHIAYSSSSNCSQVARHNGCDRIGVFGTPLSNELIDKNLDPITQLSKILHEGDEINVFNSDINYLEENIKTFKWMESDEYSKIVSQCNFSLVDDKSDDIDFANYSFPTKLVFSIYNSLPVLYTGPRDSAVAQFILKENIGVHASPADLNDLRLKFDSLKTNEKFFKRNCQKCYVKNFQQEIQVEKLNKVLGAFSV